MNFKVKIEQFEGPIDALLQLIEKRKMTINEISLSQIADEYIQFVRDLSYESISDITHFILVASTLTLIKSKSLLPNLELTEEEEGDIDDLKKRIEVFKIYQELAEQLKNKISHQKNFFYPKTRKKEIQFIPDPRLSLNILGEALQSVFKEIPEIKQVKKEATLRIAVHIEDMMESLEERIKKEMKGDFDTFISSKIENQNEPKAVRVYKVVGFLAMLELVKNGVLQVLQEANFKNINIESTVSEKEI